jgi:hypothetical protein
LSAAEKHNGSWWTDWRDWVARFGGDKVPARKPGAGKLKILEDAPGSFAKFRLDAQAATADPAGPAEAGASARKPRKPPRRKTKSGGSTA